MEPQFDREHERQERTPPPAPRQAEEPDAMQLASHIGNQGVQRLARSPQLQRSPAAAGLVRGRVLARQEEEEPEGGAAPAAGAESATEAAEPAAEAGGNENAAEAAGNENAEAGGNENAEAGGNENAPVEEEEAA